MKKEQCTKEAFKIIGLTGRSNNKHEVDLNSSKIFPIVRDFVHQKVADRIPSRIQPGTLICGYMDYESDHTGDYTYFISELVDPSLNLPSLHFQ